VATITPPIQSNLAAVQDHSRTFTDLTLVYPVISRRSGGLSLGVNLNPDKRCNFDCVYCEVDRRSPGRALAVDPQTIRAELTALVRAAKDGRLGLEPRFREVAELTRTIKDIAFSGDGEPTMIPNFAACVDSVVEVKQAEGLSDAKIVLITDAAGLNKADVQRGLDLMDAHNGEIWGKLDAGTPAYFKLVNRSHVSFDRILANLLATAQVRPIVIQTLFLKLHDAPMPAEELAAYCARLDDIVRGGGRIKEVHAYTIARPTPEPWARKLNAAELEAIAQTVRERTGLRVLTFA
jgi:wyosine [tRNA(Phe)-imidazoG37] synthetase (radical SAM superfamily)